ncbi:MAG: hypothetical protein sL5_02040 [Candidatus Mesenet longicola]|uniref:Uncharacterized protein n=1 Tax=Candidatus Mesenet longicola TaxID=1892558 RepID=A0A8J3HNZ1_9RICK|nr:MAG: hypothetical protein sGL2_02030 [Candidatus Mesenet longicola]GHM59211.1 MAG: hypothetical protein sL5_02040 [Candidatus Mesenet longicola]
MRKKYPTDLSERKWGQIEKSIIQENRQNIVKEKY